MIWPSWTRRSNKKIIYLHILFFLFSILYILLCNIISYKFMNSILQKILQYWIYFLLFTSFFLFSHLFYLLWIEKEINIYWIWGFEWIKSIFILWIWILSFIFLLLFEDKQKDKNNIFWLYSWIITLLIIISSIFSIQSWGFIFWFSEKHHGWLYYISLIFIFLALITGYKKRDYYKTLNIIFIYFLILGIYWIIQKLWLDPLLSSYQTRVSLTRVFSTLWNANYLAWVSLILLPLCLLIINKYYKYFMFIFCLFILLLTQSYFWIFLASLYIIYKSYTLNKKLFIWLILLLLTFSLQVFNNSWIEKLWSMKARPYIWISTVSAIVESPKTFLIWNWPDTLQEVFHQYKHEKLNIYETSTYTADRSHNIFLDILYFFWILWWGIMIIFLLYSLKISNNLYISESITLFLLFFSFNIPVTIHFIIILILLAWIYKKIW